MRKKYEEDVKNITQINSMNEILCSLTKMQYLPTQS